MNQNKFVWENIVEEYQKNPRDVKTIPFNQSGKWFYVHTEKGNVYITDAEYHSNSSKLKSPIKLKKEEFVDMLNIFYRRKNGEKISQEAKRITYYQVYWYGIFADMGL